MARLSRIMLIVRSVESGLNFYKHGLGMHVEASTDSFARLRGGNGVSIELTAAETEAQCSAGYSPVLTFEIDDMDTTIPQLVQLGATLDGRIRYEAYGKVAAVRSADGHMVGLIERAMLPDGADVKIAAGIAAQRQLNHKDGENQ